MYVMIVDCSKDSMPVATYKTIIKALQYADDMVRDSPPDPDPECETTCRVSSSPS